MQLDEVREGDDWWTISERLDVSVLQLRMHNPFLATRALRVGQLVAFPPTPRTGLFVSNGEGLEYRTRHGDNYLLLSFVLDVDRDALRDQNGLWRLQTLPADQVLQIPLTWKGKYNEYETKPGDTLRSVAKVMKSQPWRIIPGQQLVLGRDASARYGAQGETIAAQSNLRHPQGVARRHPPGPRAQVRHERPSDPGRQQHGA